MNEDLVHRIDRLKIKYPQADVVAVLVWKINNPRVGLESLMKKSHRNNFNRTHKKFIEAVCDGLKSGIKQGLDERKEYVYYRPFRDEIVVVDSYDHSLGKEGKLTDAFLYAGAINWQVGGLLSKDWEFCCWVYLGEL